MPRGVAVSASGSGKSKWSQTESETNGVSTYWLLSEQSTGEWQFFTCQFNLCDSSQSQVEFFDDWLTYSEVIGIFKNFIAICHFSLGKERKREGEYQTFSARLAEFPLWCYVPWYSTIFIHIILLLAIHYYSYLLDVFLHVCSFITRLMFQVIMNDLLMQYIHTGFPYYYTITLLLL